MNNEDKEILERYLKDRRRNRIIVLILVISLTLICYIVKYNLQYKIEGQGIQNTFNELSHNVFIHETLGLDIEGKRENDNVNELQEVDQNKDKEVKYSINKENTQKKQKENTDKVKKESKEFLFKDGYNMGNVSQVAQDYLKASGYSGKCIPIKDEEGICIGMKVIFD